MSKKRNRFNLGIYEIFEVIQKTVFKKPNCLTAIRFYEWYKI